MVEIKNFIQDFLPLGVFLAFLASLINLIVTTRGIKKAKFIDTITSERIKWLDILRNEGSEIIAELDVFLARLYSEVENIKNQYPSESSIAEANFEYQKNYLNVKNSNILSNNELISKNEFIKKLTLFKLRLNHKEDIEMINNIDNFIDLIKAEYISENEIFKIEKNIEIFIKKLQITLKNEWEKVKKEAK